MAYADKDVGARGVIRSEVTQMSQDLSANTSSVRVRGYIWLSSGGPSGDETGGCKVSFTGQNSSGIQNGDFPYIYAPTKRLMLERTYTVAHNADGAKTVSYTFNFGPTITSNFGSGGSVTCTTALTQIPRAPAAVGAPTLTSLGGGAVNVAWSPPNQGGSAIDFYHLMYADNKTWPPTNSVTVQVADDTTISGLSPNKNWYFWVTAHNEYGFGDWSPYSTIQLTVKGPWVKSAGIWRESQGYVKVAGVWRVADSYVKPNGVWKPL